MTVNLAANDSSILRFAQRNGSMPYEDGGLPIPSECLTKGVVGGWVV